MWSVVWRAGEAAGGGEVRLEHLATVATVQVMGD